MTRNRTSDEDMQARKDTVLASKLVLSGERFATTDVSQLLNLNRRDAQSLLYAMIKDRTIVKIELPAGKRAYMTKRPSILSKCWRQMYRDQRKST
jgi:hypothetical protein